MVEELKQMQRSDPVAKEQWHAYVDAYGNGVRDPNRHDATFVSSFVEQYMSGARLESNEGKELVQYIKQGKRKSPAWKQVWEMYADTRMVDGRPKHDPAAHTPDFLEGFFEFVANMAVGSGAMMSGNMGGMGGMVGMDAYGGMGGFGGMGFGESAPKMMKAGSDSQLVQKIKNYQRMGQAQKEAWHTYCDTSLGGSRDPSRHDEAALQTFISQYGVP